MAQISEIAWHDIVKAQRFDAEYFDPECLKIEDAIQNIGSTQLAKSNVKLDCSAFYPSIVPFYNFAGEGVPFLRVNEIQNGLVEIRNDTCFLPKEIVDRYSSNIATAKAGDLVIAKGGNTLGKVGLLTDQYEDYAVCRDLIIVKTHEAKQLNIFFLWMFLHSSTGQKHLLRTASQTGQPHLTINKLAKLSIPIFKEQEQFEEIFKKSESMKSLSMQKFTQANQLLLQELGLEEYLPEHTLAYEGDFESLLEDRRMDAEYYQPKFQVIVEKIKKTKHDTLESLVSYVKKGIEVGSEAYEDEGKPFIRVSNLSVSGLNDNNQQTITEELCEELRDKFEPKKGEVLLSKDGTPGIAYFVDENVQGIISGGLLRLKPKKEIEGEYLALVLNSLVVQMQVKRDAGGAIIVHWRPDQVKNTLIPILDDGKRTEIVTLMRESAKARKESIKMLDDAKKLVETLIEEKARVGKAV